MKTIKEDGMSVGASSLPANKVGDGQAVKGFDPLLFGDNNNILKRKILQSLDKKKKAINGSGNSGSQ